MLLQLPVTGTFAAALFYAFAAMVCSAAETESTKVQIVDWSSTAAVTWTDAGAPIGRFLLIRYGPHACAVRFNEAYRGGDQKPSTAFDSGEESLFALYDWYYQGDGTGDFSKSNVSSGNGKVAKGPLKGIGRLAFRTGDSEIKCGRLTLRWMYPTRIDFNAKGKDRDASVQLAPTKWSDLSQVKFMDSSIRWYQLDQKRKAILIPIDAL